jgi:predicted dinucleotide-binding enzyme
MKIGILGAGHIGATLARHFVAAGHDVALGNSRGPDTLRDLEAELGERAHAATAAEAARFGELVVVAIPLRDYRSVPPDAVAGKVVIDTMNYDPSRDGRAELDSDETTSSELVQRHLPDAFVAKAFNSIRWDSLRDKARPGAAEGHLGVPIAGDDLAAKQEVDDLPAELGSGELAERLAQ